MYYDASNFPRFRNYDKCAIIINNFVAYNIKVASQYGMTHSHPGSDNGRNFRR